MQYSEIKRSRRRVANNHINKKPCERCEVITRGLWRRFGYFYCYRCYMRMARDRVKEKLKRWDKR